MRAHYVQGCFSYVFHTTLLRGRCYCNVHFIDKKNWGPEEFRPLAKAREQGHGRALNMAGLWTQADRSATPHCPSEVMLTRVGRRHSQQATLMFWAEIFTLLPKAATAPLLSGTWQIYPILSLTEPSGHRHSPGSPAPDRYWSSSSDWASVSWGRIWSHQ